MNGRLAILLVSKLTFPIEMLRWWRRCWANCWNFSEFLGWEDQLKIGCIHQKVILCPGMSIDFFWLITIPRASSIWQIIEISWISSSFACCRIRMSFRYMNRCIPMCWSIPITSFITFSLTLELISFVFQLELGGCWQSWWTGTWRSGRHSLHPVWSAKPLIGWDQGGYVVPSSWNVCLSQKC